MDNNLSGCIVYDIRYDQVLEETVAIYLHRTVAPGETIRDRRLKRQAFLAVLHCVAVTFEPQGVSQPAACDGILNQTTFVDPCQEAQGNVLAIVSRLKESY